LVSGGLDDLLAIFDGQTNGFLEAINPHAGQPT